MKLIKGTGTPKIINQIPNQVLDAFDKSSPQFLVVGIKRNGEQYAYTSFHCPERKNMLESIAPEFLVRHKVFKVGEVYGLEAELKREAKEYMEAKTRDERLALFEKLKKEFEPQLVTE